MKPSSRYQRVSEAPGDDKDPWGSQPQLQVIASGKSGQSNGGTAKYERSALSCKDKRDRLNQRLKGIYRGLTQKSINIRETQQDKTQEHQEEEQVQIRGLTRRWDLFEHPGTKMNLREKITTAQAERMVGARPINKSRDVGEGALVCGISLMNTAHCSVVRDRALPH